ncbi:MAG: hypothetical protein LBJ12_05230 [Oscillospiraceae bacterium]|jgi:hypothetical protein|nr:hypothetical protein [Oscillospiraceae bacterium]
MKTLFKTKKAIIGIALALVLVIASSVTVFAAWPTYGGNDDHNGRIATQPAITAPGSITTVELPNNGSGWDGMDTTAVMRTTPRGDTYAYAVYDGYAVSGNNGGGRLAKINCATGDHVWDIQLSPTSGFQLSTPVLAEGARNQLGIDLTDVLYVGVTGFTQLLQNPNFDYNNSAWTITGGAKVTGGVNVTGNTTATLSQSVTVNPAFGNRVAVGILAGTTTNAPTANVTVNVYFGSTATTPAVTQSFTPSSAIADTSDPTQLYYYLNANFPAGTYNSPILVTVQTTSGNDNKTIKVDYVDLYSQSGSLVAVTNVATYSPIVTTIVTGISGQINTPITKYGNYLYFGTYAGNNLYYQVDMSGVTLPFAANTAITGTPVIKTFTGSGGFYWAGAYSDGEYVYFGGDGGYLYYLPVTAFGGTASASNTVTLSGAGNVRSSISTDGISLYFTSQSGLLWKSALATSSTAPVPTGISVSTFVSKTVSITSTPAISANGYIYTGYYSGFSDGGVVAVPLSNFAQGQITIVASGFPVQASPIVYTDVETTFSDYVFFTTNAAAGTGYCYEFNGSTPAGATWTGGGSNYALQGFASDNGYLVYGDDSDHLYIIH